MHFGSEMALLTTNVALGGEVRAALEASRNGFAPLALYSDLRSLVQRLQTDDIAIAMVDVDEYPDSILDEIEPVISRYSGVRFVLLTSELRNDLVMKAMQAGIRHVQLKESVSEQLANALHRIAPGKPVNSPALGSVTTVLSAGGGCGATTVAVNLANELQLTTSKPVLIIDLDYTYGAVAAYLELRGRYGIADVLSHNGDIDPNLIASTALKHSEKLHALISPVSIDYTQTHTLDAGRLEKVIRACKESHAFVVIDAPRVSIDIAIALAKMSDTTLIMLQPMIKDIRIAKSLLTSLSASGVPPAQIKPIINRYHKRNQMISMDDAQEVLGDIPIGRLSNNYSSAVRGINYGEPLARSAPRSSLRKELAELATQVSDLDGNDNTRLHTLSEFDSLNHGGL